MEHLHREVATSIGTKARDLKPFHVNVLLIALTVEPELAIIMLGSRA
jgi:hypothetical protein